MADQRPPSVISAQSFEQLKQELQRALDQIWQVFRDNDLV